jgi:hypothetical protein
MEDSNASASSLETRTEHTLCRAFAVLTHITTIMGGAASSFEAPPDVDLLPPRIDARPASVGRLAASPFEFAFGVEERISLIHSLLLRDHLHGRIHLSPANDPRIKVAADARALSGDSDASRAGISFQDVVKDSALVELSATVGQHEPLTVRATTVVPDYGVGVYARLPLTDSLARRVVGASDPDSTGLAARAADLVGRASNGFHVLSSEVIAPPSGRQREWPEFGGLWTSASNKLSVGAHVRTGEGMPVKAWFMSTPVPGLSLGLQASLFAREAMREAKGGMRIDWSGTGSAAAGVVPVDVDAAMSFKMNPLYEASLMYRGAVQEIVFGFVNHQTFRRKVYNPTEEANVKGIFNYVDLGLEVRQRLDGSPSEMALAGSWQINRRVLARAKISNEGAAAALTVKSWTSPDFTGTLAYGVGPRGPFASVGLSAGTVQVQPSYRQIVLGEQQQAVSRQFRSRPDLSVSRSPLVEQDSVRLPPAGAGRPSPFVEEDDSLIPRRRTQ